MAKAVIDTDLSQSEIMIRCAERCLEDVVKEIMIEKRAKVQAFFENSKGLPPALPKHGDTPMLTIPEWALIHQDAIVLTDRGGLVLWINDAVTEHCGYDLATMRGNKPGRLLQRGDVEKSAVQAMRAAIAGGTFTAVTVTNYHRDGTAYKSLIVLGPLKLGGRVTHFAAAERRFDGAPGAEAELRATLDRFLADLKPAGKPSTSGKPK